jgi:hypothetical protein
MGQIGSPETSVSSHFTLRDNSEDGIIQYNVILDWVWKSDAQESQTKAVTAPPRTSVQIFSHIALSI